MIPLSGRQQATVAAALTILAAVVIVAAIGVLFWIVGAFLTRFSNVFLPLAVAAVAALVFRPYFTFLRTRLRLRPTLALTVLFLSVLAPVTGFLWFFGALAVSQVSDLLSRVPEWWQAASAWATTHAPQVEAFLRDHGIADGVGDQQESLLKGLSAFSSGALSAGAAVLRWVGGLLGWAVFPVYFAFFLLLEPTAKVDLSAALPFLKSDIRDDVSYLVREFVNVVVAFFRGQLIVAFVQGLLFAAGFSVVHLKYGFILGLALGFLNVIPYLGSIVGLSLALPIAFFQPGGGIGRVLSVLAVFAVVQLVEGYILTPKVMGSRTGLHPVVIIVAIFFWGTALEGIMGMVLAVPLTAFLVVLWRLARDKYLTELA